MRFNHECKRNNVLPKSLRFCPLIKSRKEFKLAWKMGWKFLQLRISDSLRKINMYKRKIFELRNKLENLLTSTEWNNLCLHARQKSRLIQTNSEKVQRDKLNRLLSSLPAKEKDPVQKKWVKNLSDRNLTDDQVALLSKGSKFALAPKEIPILDIVCGVEDAYDKCHVIKNRL